jgi:hypothetical protein
MDKRGLSPLITTVIIILVSIVAISIVSSVVFLTVGESSSKISGDCFVVKLEVVDCVQGAGFTIVDVKRNTGAGDITDIAFLLTAGGEQIRYLADTNPQNLNPPDELETDSYTFNPLIATQVDIAAIIGDQRIQCEANRKPFICHP